MRFRVALSFVQKIIKQWRETGDVSPKPHGGGQKLGVADLRYESSFVEFLKPRLRLTFGYVQNWHS